MKKLVFLLLFILLQSNLFFVQSLLIAQDDNSSLLHDDGDNESLDNEDSSDNEEDLDEEIEPETDFSDTGGAEEVSDDDDAPVYENETSSVDDTDSIDLYIDSSCPKPVSYLYCRYKNPKDDIYHIRQSGTIGSANNTKSTKLAQAAKKLIIAARRGSLADVVDALVAGASPNTISEYRKTVLQEAILSHQLKIAYYLLSRGADFEKKNDDGDTALNTAIIAGEVDLAKYLIDEKDAQTDIINNNGQGLLELAIIYSQPGALDYLLKEKIVKVNKQSKSGFMPIGLAAYLGDTKSAGVLLKYGADVDSRDSSKYRTPLMIAASRGDTKMIKFLLASGANTKREDNEDKTAIFIAAENKQQSAVQLLMPVSLDVLNKKTDGGITVLLACVLSGMQDLAIDLLAHGSNVNVNNTAGITALMFAASHGYSRLVKYMIEKTNVDKDAKIFESTSEKLAGGYTAYYREGWNVVDVAEAAKQYDIVQYLVLDKKMEFNQGKK